MTKNQLRLIDRMKHKLTITLRYLFENIAYQLDWLINISQIKLIQLGNHFQLILFYYHPIKPYKSKQLKRLLNITMHNQQNKRLTKLAKKNKKLINSYNSIILRVLLSKNNKITTSIIKNLNHSLAYSFNSLLGPLKYFKNNNLYIQLQLIRLYNPILNDDILSQYLDNQTINHSFNRLCLKYFRYINQYYNNIKDLNTYISWSSHILNKNTLVHNPDLSNNEFNKANQTIVQSLIRSSNQINKKNKLIDILAKLDTRSSRNTTNQFIVGGLNNFNINNNNNNNILRFADAELENVIFNFDNKYVPSIPRGINLVLKGRIPRDKVKPIQTVKSNLFALPVGLFSTIPHISYLDQNPGSSLLINRYYVSKVKGSASKQKNDKILINSSIQQNNNKINVGITTQFNPQLGSHTLWTRVIK